MLAAAARCTSCIKGARHLGAQTQAADTVSFTTSSWEPVSHMKPK